MRFFQIPQAPYIPSLDQRKEVKSIHRLPIPIKVREEEEPIPIFPFCAMFSNDHIFLLCPAFNNVEHPVKSSLLLFLLHKRPDMVDVDLRRLRNHANSLARIFIDVLLCTGPNEVDFQIVGS